MLVHFSLNIFIDLDGTILDVSQRYYYSHSCAAKSVGCTPLPQTTYARLRKYGRNETEIGRLLTNRIEKYLSVWNKTIESKKALSKDRLQEKITTCLQKLEINDALYLVTLRKNKSYLYDQICKFGLQNFFSDVLSGYTHDDPVLYKAELIKTKSDGGLLVGDTEVDIAVARLLKFDSIIVTYGLRGKAFLRKKGAKVSATSVNELTKLLILRVCGSDCENNTDNR
jgi:phosphoglycolate phosphatase-like HAD superfamily hydrolase